MKCTYTQICRGNIKTGVGIMNTKFRIVVASGKEGRRVKMKNMHNGV